MELTVISESYTIEDFARALHLSHHDLHNLKLIFVGVEQGDLSVLSAIGVKVRFICYLKFDNIKYLIYSRTPSLVI